MVSTGVRGGAVNCKGLPERSGVVGMLLVVVMFGSLFGSRGLVVGLGGRQRSTARAPPIAGASKVWLQGEEAPAGARRYLVSGQYT
jgi:hypothetical protein